MPLVAWRVPNPGPRKDTWWRHGPCPVKVSRLCTSSARVLAPGPWNSPCSDVCLGFSVGLHQPAQQRRAAEGGEDIGRPEVAGLAACDFSRKLLPPAPPQEDGPMLLYPGYPRQPVVVLALLSPKILPAFRHSPAMPRDHATASTMLRLQCGSLWTWPRPTLPTPCIAAGSASCWLWAAFPPHK